MISVVNILTSSEMKYVRKTEGKTRKEDYNKQILEKV